MTATQRSRRAPVGSPARVRLGVGLVAASLSACSTGPFYDPVFVAVDQPVPGSAPCPTDSTCLLVVAHALPEAAGRTGTCEVYEADVDPATAEPLATTRLEVPSVAASEMPIAWDLTLAGEIDAADLNAVCRPMIEG